MNAISEDLIAWLNAMREELIARLKVNLMVDVALDRYGRDPTGPTPATALAARSRLARGAGTP